MCFYLGHSCGWISSPGVGTCKTFCQSHLSHHCLAWTFLCHRSGTIVGFVFSSNLCSVPPRVPWTVKRCVSQDMLMVFFLVPLLTLCPLKPPSSYSIYNHCHFLTEACMTFIPTPSGGSTSVSSGLSQNAICHSVWCCALQLSEESLALSVRTDSVDLAFVWSWGVFSSDKCPI